MMLRVSFSVFLFLTHTSAQMMNSFHQVVELAEDKTPYDYVRERLDAIGTDPRSGIPLSNSYEVEESEDYPEPIEGAASAAVLNTAGGIGLGGIGGYGPIGAVGLNQGLGLGVGHLGHLGGLGIGGANLANGVGLAHGGLAHGGLGYIQNQGIGGLGVGGLGVGGLGVGGLGGGLLYHPIVTQVGGGYVDKKAYDAAQKKGADENLEKLEKKAEEQVKHDQEAYQHAAAVAKGEKGDSSFYKDEEAKKKAAGDEKFYEGGQKFDKHGANEELHKAAKSHKKGHISKGYRSSSSKNEEEKTESFYDEAHDEGDHKLAGQNAGSFGEQAHQGFKGAHEEKVLDANAAGKEGHHVAAHKFDDSKANKGEFLQKDYKGGAEVLEKFNNLGAQSIHGHQEASGGFQHNKGILPIHARR